MVYFALTAVQTVLYLFGGMGLFDAVTHSFSTLATGGFSTRNDSMAGFSPYLQWVTIAFMYLAGINFTLHFRAATGRPVYFRDQEWRFFTTVILVATVAIVAIAILGAGDAPLGTAVRDALFQTVAITTTTGFVSADYEVWLPGAQMVLFALFFVGGMAGSTGGGIKAMRVLLLLEQTASEIRKHLHPRAVIVTRIGSTPVKDEVVGRIVGFALLYMLLCLAGAVALGLIGIDPLTAIGASIASVGNVGPAFGAVGPTDNYGWMSSTALGVLSFLMLVGRLEIYTVLVLFSPEIWRRRIPNLRSGRRKS